MEFGVDAGLLRSVATAEGYRGEGLGRRMVHAALEVIGWQSLSRQKRKESRLARGK